MFDSLVTVGIRGALTVKISVSFPVGEEDGLLHGLDRIDVLCGWFATSYNNMDRSTTIVEQLFHHRFFIDISQIYTLHIQKPDGTPPGQLNSEKNLNSVTRNPAVIRRTKKKCVKKQEPPKWWARKNVICLL